jgi:tetratricopeptide (TPR) repeat protein
MFACSHDKTAVYNVQIKAAQKQMDLGQYDKAIEAYKNIHKFYPKNSFILFAVTAAIVADGVYDDAGLKVIDRKKLSEAIYYIEKALLISPDNSQIGITYALLLVGDEQYLAAVNIFERFFDEIDKKNAEAVYLRYAKALYFTGKYGQSKSLVQEMKSVYSEGNYHDSMEWISLIESIRNEDY